MSEGEYDEQYVNEVKLMGRLTADPEVHTTRTGALVVRLLLETIHTWFDQAMGRPCTRRDEHRITILNNPTLADIAVRRCVRGTRVLVNGRQQNRDKSSEVILGPTMSRLLIIEQPRQSEPLARAS